MQETTDHPLAWIIRNKNLRLILTLTIQKSEKEIEVEKYIWKILSSTFEIEISENISIYFQLNLAYFNVSVLLLLKNTV